jgi:hypothetical protein
MMRLPVRSRSGNIVLAIMGSIYAISAISILIWFLLQVWGAAHIFDRVMQLALVGAAACGVWIALSALENLGVRPLQRRWRAHKVSS